MHKTEIIAIVAFKGGVGKTTTAVNLAVALANEGKETLLIDLDPTGSASTTWNKKNDNSFQTAADLFREKAASSGLNCIQPTPVPQLSVVVSNETLKNTETDLEKMLARDIRLKRALQPLLESFDYVVIDNQPALGLLNANALAAATRVVIPVATNLYSMEALNSLWGILQNHYHELNPALLDGQQLIDPAKSKILITRLDRSAKGSIAAVDVLRQIFPEHVFQTIVRKNATLEDAQKELVSIFEFDKKKKRGPSRGAEDYQSLAKEVLSQW